MARYADLILVEINHTVEVQNEGSARLRTPGRPSGTYSTCTFPAHDHTTSTGRDREALDVPAPMRCRRGGQRAHYD
ncbi:hypothetical protein [Micromonospora inositola]|uniref:hypothetical protein n=1 Tax=Micromonospora inositola TaxID=47865 RepID=UPI000B5AEEBC|nr:hypothetical protein [Micromonospora inositola]